MKKVLRGSAVWLTIAVLFICCGCKRAEKVYPDHTEEFYVNDFAGVLKEDDAREVFVMGATLDKETAKVLKTDVGAQVAAVTVETTEGEEISDYALGLGRQWGLGDKEKNNGVLILLATEDREVYVAVGYGLEGRLPDSKTGRIIDDYAIEYFKENDFSAGMLNLYRAIVREVYVEYDLDVPENISEPQRYRRDVDYKEAGISWGVILLIIILCVVYLWSHGFFVPFIGFGGGRGGFGGFSGGGFGGHGGGFGGFSGGGGSFGGGGAGRGF